MVATIRQRNVITEGDQIEFYGPGFRHVETMVKNLRLAETDEHIDRAPNPMTLLHIDVPFAVKRHIRLSKGRLLPSAPCRAGRNRKTG